MRNITLRESGFSIIEVCIGLLVVVIIGAVGWFGYNNFIKTTPTDSVAPASSEQKSSESASASNLDQTDSDYKKPNSWQTYIDPDIPFIFDYPSSWVLNKKKEESRITLTATDAVGSTQILSIASQKLRFSTGVAACQIKRENDDGACSYISNELVGYFYQQTGNTLWSGNLSSTTIISINLIKQDQTSKNSLIDLAKSVRKQP